MELTVVLYVDGVLNARDLLLSANIKVVGYDYYPNGAACLRVYDEDCERGGAALTAGGIKFTITPPRGYSFVT